MLRTADKVWIIRTATRRNLESQALLTSPVTWTASRMPDRKDATSKNKCSGKHRSIVGVVYNTYRYRTGVLGAVLGGSKAGPGGFAGQSYWGLRIDLARNHILEVTP